MKKPGDGRKVTFFEPGSEETSASEYPGESTGPCWVPALPQCPQQCHAAPGLSRAGQLLPCKPDGALGRVWFKPQRAHCPRGPCSWHEDKKGVGTHCSGSGRGGRGRNGLVNNSVIKPCLSDAEALMFQRLVELTKFVSISKVIWNGLFLTLGACVCLQEDSQTAALQCAPLSSQVIKKMSLGCLISAISSFLLEFSPWSPRLPRLWGPTKDTTPKSSAGQPPTPPRPRWRRWSPVSCSTGAPLPLLRPSWRAATPQDTSPTGPSPGPPSSWTTFPTCKESRWLLGLARLLPGLL